MRTILIMVGLVLLSFGALADSPCQFIQAKSGVSFASLIKDGYEMKLWVGRGVITSKGTYVLLQKGGSVFACDPTGTISISVNAFSSSATCGELIEPKTCSPENMFFGPL